MESASDCRFFRPSSTETCPLFICSRIRSAAEDTWDQVDSAGGAMVFFSWSPNAASLSLPESASSSHAFWEAGRSEDFSYHLACVSGLLALG